MSKVAAIVVTYNRLELLKENIEALLELENQLSNIVIINNNSNDGTEEYLNSLSNSLFVIKNSKINLGGAGGFNYGVKVAFDETDADFFWIMDDDTIPEKDTLVNLINADERLIGNYGYLCSHVVMEDGTDGNIPQLVGDWTTEVDKGLIKVSSATFVSLFTKRDVVSELGLPISEFFIWGDDTEYTTRISQKYNSYFVIDSKVIHKAKSVRNVDIINDTADRLPRYFYRYRNNIYITRKYENSKKLLFIMIKHMYLAVKILFIAKNNKFKRSNLIFKGIFSGLKFNPNVENIGENK
ncbi:hypothetical protein A4W87_02090 [Latilactobacillus sakei]|uniref:glycosyltransferase n=1 Tax=Latilactobacillus sakei TaxID=1599 RepID=UPI0009785E89|nr:glycosyltransferase [Latilactobacillus sakei]USG03724.1 hypothetical protein A4W87_02090 [Latilactobacillus sakei]